MLPEGWAVSAIRAAARPLFLSGVLPASRRWGILPREDTGQKTRYCMQREGSVLYGQCWGRGSPSITGGGRPLSFALFFLALHVSLASVLHSSESAKRHRSTGSRGSGSGGANALKYIGCDFGDSGSFSPEGSRVSDIGSSPSALHTASGEGVISEGGVPMIDPTTECGVRKSSVS